jgi:hypothetical protein
MHKDVTLRNKNKVTDNIELKAKLSNAKKRQEESTQSLDNFRIKCDTQIAKLEALYSDLQQILESNQIEIEKTVSNGT